MTSSARPRSERPRFDDVDLQLINVLQESARISWTDAGRILRLSPTAVAARWNRLESEGVAWISVHHNAVAPDYLTAMVELGCLPAGRNALVERLMRDGRVVSIDESSRGSDLVLTVVVTDLDALSRYVLDDLEPIAEITSVRSSVVLNVFGTGADWRAGTLDSEQMAELRRLRGAGGGSNGADVNEPASASDHLPPESWEIAEQLVRNGRLSVAELARAIDRNPATVRRHLAALLATRRLSFRCDIMHGLVGYPVTAAFFARVPSAELAGAVEKLQRLPQLRMGLQVTGEANLMFSVLMRSVNDVARFQHQLGMLVPSIGVMESMVLLRSRKRMGWILDEAGRNTRELVPPVVLREVLGTSATRAG